MSRSQYIATCNINYGPYIDNMLALENFATPSVDSLLDLLIQAPKKLAETFLFPNIIKS